MYIIKQIILFFIMLQGLTGEQFVRVPILFSHFAEHNLQNSMSFSEFLSHHYLDFNHEDEDDEKDQSLPFKTIQVSCFQFVPTEPLGIYVLALAVEFKKSHFSYLEELYPDPIFDIVHPPSNLV